MKKLELIIEKGDGTLWARIESNGWMPTPYGSTIQEVISNLKDLVADYITNEGKDDKTWNKINWDCVAFDLKYNIVLKNQAS